MLNLSPSAPNLANSYNKEGYDRSQDLTSTTHTNDNSQYSNTNASAYRQDPNTLPGSEGVARPPSAPSAHTYHHRIQILSNRPRSSVSTASNQVPPHKSEPQENQGPEENISRNFAKKPTLSPPLSSPKVVYHSSNGVQYTTHGVPTVSTPLQFNTNRTHIYVRSLQRDRPANNINDTTVPLNGSPSVKKLELTHTNASSNSITPFKVPVAKGLTVLSSQPHKSQTSTVNIAAAPLVTRFSQQQLQQVIKSITSKLSQQTSFLQNSCRSLEAKLSQCTQLLAQKEEQITKLQVEHSLAINRIRTYYDEQLALARQQFQSGAAVQDMKNRIDRSFQYANAKVRDFERALSVAIDAHERDVKKMESSLESALGRATTLEQDFINIIVSRLYGLYFMAILSAEKQESRFEMVLDQLQALKQEAVRNQQIQTGNKLGFRFRMQSLQDMLLRSEKMLESKCNQKCDCRQLYTASYSRELKLLQTKFTELATQLQKQIKSRKPIENTNEKQQHLHVLAKANSSSALAPFNHSNSICGVTKPTTASPSLQSAVSCQDLANQVTFGLPITQGLSALPLIKCKTNFILFNSFTASEFIRKANKMQRCPGSSSRRKPSASSHVLSHQLQAEKTQYQLTAIQRLKLSLAQKGVDLPHACEVDQTGYLKSCESGTYLYDKDGDLFKLTWVEIQQAVSAQIILI